MNRRHFLGQLVLGSATLAYHAPLEARQNKGGLTVKFVGMMGYITRSDKSMLVALPGQHAMGHYGHVPFVMARADSAIADVLGMVPMPGVVPGAFDMKLEAVTPGSFAFRCLDGIDLDIRSITGEVAVTNRADQIAQMQKIAPGKRLRGNLRRWAQATITVQGGSLQNSAAHPDAGKVWSFGDYKQTLTDATLYRTPGATIRLDAGSEVRRFTATANRTEELWVVSAVGARADIPNPKRLEHAHLLFEYFANASPITPTCDDAEGRFTGPTELPCASTAVASRLGGYTAAAPPFSEVCPGGGWCEPCE